MQPPTAALANTQTAQPTQGSQLNCHRLVQTSPLTAPDGTAATTKRTTDLTLHSCTAPAQPKETPTAARLAVLADYPRRDQPPASSITVPLPLPPLRRAPQLVARVSVAVHPPCDRLEGPNHIAAVDTLLHTFNTVLDRRHGSTCCVAVQTMLLAQCHGAAAMVHHPGNTPPL